VVVNASVVKEASLTPCKGERVKLFDLSHGLLLNLQRIFSIHMQELKLKAAHTCIDKLVGGIGHKNSRVHELAESVCE
jgi:hypothetical protein